jgi:hypothetical protein
MIDDQPTFFIARLVADAITHTVIVETINYGRRKTGVAEGKKAKLGPEIGLKDATNRLHSKQTLRHDRVASISSQTNAPRNYHRTISVEILQQPYELLASGKVMAK